MKERMFQIVAGTILVPLVMHALHPSDGRNMHVELGEPLGSVQYGSPTALVASASYSINVGSHYR